MSHWMLKIPPDLEEIDFHLTEECYSDRSIPIAIIHNTLLLIND